MALPAREGFFAYAAHGQAVLRTTSQSPSVTAPLVGEPLAKRRSFAVCQGLSYKERWHCEAMTERLDKGKATHERKTQKTGRDGEV